ncbi:hypothetical protein [Streptomyces alboniger]|uniref:hypothetical protein n=1 Tax=Streptomyces alboniger TaxID=132473 RepID=UPI0008777927|nr:hypothetical protein [Streptomyces alboniger]
MSDKPTEARSLRARDISGQAVVGDGNHVVGAGDGAAKATATVTEAQLAALHDAFTSVRAEIPPEDPATDRAAELLDELEEAVTTPQTDLTTMAYVRRWFATNLPALAGSVAALLVHPVVAQLAEAAGGGLAAGYHDLVNG